MSLARIDQLMDRFIDAPSTEAAEAALRELATLDAEHPETAEEHEPIGDLYGELADDFFEQGLYEEAIRLQRLALDHPCTNPRREIGTWLGYRFVSGDREAAIADLHTERVGPDGDAASDAFLIGAFAEAAERADAPLALSLHDEALVLATATGDEDVLAIARVPRALLRRDLDLAPDADDIEAFRELESLGQRLSAGTDEEAVQLFLPRDELDAAVAKWPKEMDELGMGDADAFYRELELFWREWPAAGGAIVLRPLTVALLEEHGSTPGQAADEMPEALVEALEARDDGEPWPPGRNDPCWCGSGRKYKKCCGAA